MSVDTRVTTTHRVEVGNGFVLIAQQPKSPDRAIRVEISKPINYGPTALPTIGEMIDGLVDLERACRWGSR